MKSTSRLPLALLLAVIFALLVPATSSAPDRLCDPSFEDCYSPLLDLVRPENNGLDVAFYMIELPTLADAIIARYQAGVPVRLLVEPRADLKFPNNQPLLDKFQRSEERRVGKE